MPYNVTLLCALADTAAVAAITPNHTFSSHLLHYLVLLNKYVFAAFFRYIA